MILVIDGKGNLWKIDQWGHYVIHDGPALDATIIQATFHDGFQATSEEFEQSFGVNMKLKAQATTYEIDLDELKNIFVRELSQQPEHFGLTADQISLNFPKREVGDDRFGPTSYEISGVQITVNKKGDQDG